MNQQEPGTDVEDTVRLGVPKLVCRISRKILFWGFVLALLLGAFGIVMLGFLTRMLLAHGFRDLPGDALVLDISGLALWGGWVLGRRTSRLRDVQAVVHAGGISYWDGHTYLTCSWDQIEDVRWWAEDCFEETRFTVGPFPIPGAKVRHLDHTRHRITVRRKDGVRLIFTNELQNIVALALAIQEGAYGTSSGG